MLLRKQLMVIKPFCFFPLGIGYSRATSRVTFELHPLFPGRNQSRQEKNSHLSPVRDIPSLPGTY
jgi:hypothetical protein